MRLFIRELMVFTRTVELLLVFQYSFLNSIFAALQGVPVSYKFFQYKLLLAYYLMLALVVVLILVKVRLAFDAAVPWDTFFCT